MLLCSWGIARIFHGVSVCLLQRLLHIQKTEMIDWRYFQPIITKIPSSQETGHEEDACYLSFDSFHIYIKKEHWPERSTVTAQWRPEFVSQ